MHPARRLSFSLFATLLTATLLNAPAFAGQATTTPAPKTPAKTTASKTTTAKATGTRTATAAHRATLPALPKNIPPVAAPVKVQYALRYQEIKVGTAEVAAPGQLYTVHYTGWLASDGTKFDSSYDRGKPFEFQQGLKRVIIGWDQGFEDMHVGGKRRLFIPYQLAYGVQGRAPIPPKADLIFDIELVAQRDPNAPPPQLPPAQ